MYKAIGFDFGGVLNYSKSTLPGLAEIIGVPLDELRAYYFKNNHLANVGSMSYEELWTKIATEFGHPEKAAEVVNHIHIQWDYRNNEDMLALVDELRRNGYKTGLFSNNTKEIAIKMRERGLEKHFDVFLISAEVGFQKPSAEAFNLFCKELGVLPNELIYVDDNENSLRLADEIGYHPILFKNYDQFRDELISLKIFIN